MSRDYLGFRLCTNQIFNHRKVRKERKAEQQYSLRTLRSLRLNFALLHQQVGGHYNLSPYSMILKYPYIRNLRTVLISDRVKIIKSVEKDGNIGVLVEECK